MITIPFTEYPASTAIFNIDNTSYKFLFVWNTRMAAWTMSISDTDDNVIISGIKIVLNIELIRMYRHLNIPKGHLFALDLSDDETKIAYSDFTNERGIKLVYIPEDEFAAVFA